MAIHIPSRHTPIERNIRRSGYGREPKALVSLPAQSRLSADHVNSHVSPVRLSRTRPLNGPLSITSTFVSDPEAPKLVQPMFPSGTPGTGWIPHRFRGVDIVFKRFPLLWRRLD
jgi:hypothetical protein